MLIVVLLLYLHTCKQGNRRSAEISKAGHTPYNLSPFLTGCLSHFGAGFHVHQVLFAVQCAGKSKNQSSAQKWPLDSQMNFLHVRDFGRLLSVIHTVEAE